LGGFLGKDRGVTDEAPDWLGDADWLQLQRVPRSGRILLYLVAALVTVALVWAWLAVIEVTVHGSGKVIPSSRLKTVESQDGGRVLQVLVREGQRVEAGQLLVELDPVRADASLDEHLAHISALEARVARLEALVDGRPLAPARGDVEVVAREFDRYVHEKEELEQQMELARQKRRQEQEALKSAQAHVNQLRRTLGLTREELSRLEPLLDKGAVSEIEVLRLRREVARIQGELEIARAEVAQGESSVEEAGQRIRSLASEYRNRWRRELSDALSQLEARRQSLRALEDRARHTRILAPVSGRVQQLYVNTAGEVVDPGGEVAEIVPGDETLEIEARIRPQDIAAIRPGLPARVRITAYRYVTHGALEGEVVNVSPDTIVDERGNAFYLVRVRTHEAGYGPDKPIVVGMMADVAVRVGERRLLDYLLNPASELLEQALTEP